MNFLRDLIYIHETDGLRIIHFSSRSLYYFSNTTKYIYLIFVFFFFPCFFDLFHTEYRVAWCRPPGDPRHVKKRERVPAQYPLGDEESCAILCSFFNDKFNRNPAFLVFHPCFSFFLFFFLFTQNSLYYNI